MVWFKTGSWHSKDDSSGLGMAALGVAHVATATLAGVSSMGSFIAPLIMLPGVGLVVGAAAVVAVGASMSVSKAMQDEQQKTTAQLNVAFVQWCL